MSKFERVFYVFVILAMFALVILFQLRLRETRKQEKMNVQHSAIQEQRLFSFGGESPTGEKDLVHFTAYSPNYYIILNTSTDCSHCLSMLQDLKAFNPENKLLENICIYLITTDEFPEQLPPGDSQIKTLKLSFDDWYQFGMETPSGIIANGKGDVIAHWKGYSPTVLDRALQKIQQCVGANRKSNPANPG